MAEYVSNCYSGRIQRRFDNRGKFGRDRELYHPDRNHRVMGVNTIDRQRRDHELELRDWESNCELDCEFDLLDYESDWRDNDRIIYYSDSD